MEQQDWADLGDMMMDTLTGLREPDIVVVGGGEVGSLVRLRSCCSCCSCEARDLENGERGGGELHFYSADLPFPPPLPRAHQCVQRNVILESGNDMFNTGKEDNDPRCKAFNPHAQELFVSPRKLVYHHCTQTHPKHSP